MDIILEIPSQQKKDYKEISREIRFSPIFKKFVKNKSKCRHYISFTFEHEEMIKILIEALKNLKYEYDVITETDTRYNSINI